MATENRPDPDALLAEIAPPAIGEGRLKIFLGMCPGVGKTFAMLLAGQSRLEEGGDVVIGIIETHGRVETTAVAAGMFRMPRKKFVHRDVSLEEMDLDAILARKPQLALVDELAHSNAAGSRHPKRWQDVVELLQAGIDVYTTLNIQHIESQRDVVRQITGAPVHETVPDSLIDRADEIELVDLTPDQLRKRLDEGKVYFGDRAAAASSNFFREGNLKALREIALRITAEKADRELRDFMRSRRISGPWRSRERFLVAIGSSPFSGRLIRLARRAAAAVHGTWIAVSVDTGRAADPAAQPRLENNLALARSLGAEVVLTTGASIAEALLRVARENNVTQIIVGKPLVHPVLEWLSGGSLVSKLIRDSGDIDITVVRADKSAHPWKPDFSAIGRPHFLRELGLGAVVVTGTTVLGMLLQPAIGYSTVGLLYLLTVLVSATVLSRAAILCVATMTAFTWNFLFIPPTMTFRISGAHDTVLFGLYFVVALVIGQLHARLRQRERAERRREQQTLALYQFTRSLTEKAGFTDTLESAANRLREIFPAEFAVLLKEGDTPLVTYPTAGIAINERERAVAEWAFSHGEAAGRTTNTLPQSAGFYLPIRTPRGVLGVLAAFLPSNRSLGLEERQMLETFCSQLAMVVERLQLQQEAARSEVEERSRQLQKTLLDSVSHELRTPLAVIAASAERLAGSVRDEDNLLGEIASATRRLERVVSNLLSLTRLESGSVQPRWEWCDLEDIIDEAIVSVRPDAPERVFAVEVAPDAATLHVDPGLLEDAIRNLIRNAAQHTPDGTPVEVDARQLDTDIHIRISDHGPGIPEKRREAVFEKFVRGPEARPGGLGMGLALARGFVSALGGSLHAGSRSDGASGSTFTIILPPSQP
jgi:two-component system sensor histidine kinase KdpD